MERDDWLRYLAWFVAEFRDSDRSFKEAFEDYFGSGADELFETTDDMFFDCARAEAEAIGCPTCECGFGMAYVGRAWLGAKRECDMFRCPNCEESDVRPYTGDFPFFTHGRVFPSEKYHTSTPKVIQ